VPSYRAAAGGHHCREDWVCPAPVGPPTAAVGMGARCREDWVCRDPVSPQEAAAWAADWGGADAMGLWVLAAGSAVAADAAVAAGFCPRSAAGVRHSVLAVLCLASGIAAVSSASAVNAVLAVTTLKAVRGACAGWRQTGYLGGMGLARVY
jgi:hypothetical protein